MRKKERESARFSTTAKNDRGRIVSATTVRKEQERVSENRREFERSVRG